MEKIKKDQKELENELSFLQNIVHSLPAIVYIIEMQKPGDISSCRIIWMNKRGLDFVSYTQEEIIAMGNDFFKEFLHPDDVEVLPLSINTVYALIDETVFVGMYRIKNKNQSTYSWLYGHYIILNNFDDGSIRQMLVVALDITDKMHTDNQLVSALKEINRLKFELKFSNISKREKQVLEMIIKGKTDKQIAKELFISVVTSKKHRTHLIKKTGVKNSVELVALTMEAALH
ncbi:MAG TPA: LuxR C-terminal-related transcriptional regulator [Paludibacter sp.]